MPLRMRTAQPEVEFTLPSFEVDAIKFFSYGKNVAERMTVDMGYKACWLLVEAAVVRNLCSFRLVFHTFLRFHASRRTREAIIKRHTFEMASPLAVNPTSPRMKPC